MSNILNFFFVLIHVKFLSAPCQHCLIKKFGFWHFNTLRLSFKVPASATPNEDDHGSVQKRVCGFLNGFWCHVRNHEILLVQETFVSVVVRSFPQQKSNHTEVGKEMWLSSKQNKMWSFEIFLKWHSSPIFHCSQLHWAWPKREI